MNYDGVAATGGEDLFVESVSGGWEVGYWVFELAGWNDKNSSICSTHL